MFSKKRFVDVEKLDCFDICYNNSCCCICTFIEKITKFFVFTFAHFEKKRVITFRFKRFVKDLFCKRINETKNICIQQSVSTSFCVCILLVACRDHIKTCNYEIRCVHNHTILREICCMSHSITV